MTPTVKCWRVDKEGRKIQDIDVTIKYNAHVRQPQAAKEKRIGRFSDMEDEEIGNFPCVDFGNINLSCCVKKSVLWLKRF